MIRPSSLLKVFCALTILVGLAACGQRNKNQPAFDGFLFKTKTSSVDKKVSLADFSATVFDASASLDGAREAGRYEGTKYCIANYGSSNVDWVIGPDSDPSQLTLVDNAITFRGRCDP